jgi:glycerol-3-phosphate dehydrogenase (NAD(P)+)
MPLSFSTPKKEIAIIGSGSWATALVKVFTDARNHVHWYVRDPDEAQSIRLKNRNSSYLSE